MGAGLGKVEPFQEPKSSAGLQGIRDKRRQALKGYVRQGEEDRDLVAIEFGIRFEGAIKTPEIKHWRIHRLTKGLKPLPFNTGSVVTQSPKGTVPVAYLDNEQLIMGLVHCGKRRIIFLSTIFPLLEVPQPFTKRLFNELARECL